MDRPYFSVIVPVYRVELYLRQCVDSVLDQTFRDFELILVDDGSPDGCGAICDEYAAQDRRVSVIHQENRGLAGARRAGLERAQAEYVCFVDSDDWVRRDWLAVIHGCIKENGGPDMVLYEHVRDTGPAERPLLAPAGYYDRARLEKEIYPAMLCDLRPGRFGQELVPAYMCLKAARRALFLDHYVSDPRVTLFEDIAMAYECIYYARSLVVCTEPLYVYRQREQSILTAYRPRYFQEVRACFDYLRSHLGGKSEALDRQINGACMFRLTAGLVRELRRYPHVRDAAHHAAEGLRASGLAGLVRFGGLPPAMRGLLLLIKCGLYTPAVWLVKQRM